MHDSIKDKILLYPHLSPEGRRQVEQYVASHPEFEAMLEESKDVEAVLRAARFLDEDPPSDEALAYYVATRRMTRHVAPPALRDAFARIEARLRKEPSLRARCEELDRRLAALEAGTDAAEQFERLTGHTVEPLLESAPERPAPAADRTSLRRLLYLGLRVAAVLLVGLIAYGALWQVSRQMQPTLQQVAAFTAKDFEMLGVRMRGAKPATPAVTPDALYQQALPFLQSARTTTLGLFPRYDQDDLAQAADLLDRAVAQEQEGTVLHLEATYLLGKIHLLQGDISGARAALQTVAARQDWRAEDAAALLDRIELLE